MTKTVRLVCEITIDEKEWYQNKVEREWFYSHVLKNDLVLHSNDIGDSIGELKVLEVKE